MRTSGIRKLKIRVERRTGQTKRSRSGASGARAQILAAARAPDALARDLRASVGSAGKEESRGLGSRKVLGEKWQAKGEPALCPYLFFFKKTIIEFLSIIY
jgi:hypothetical protein